MYFKWTIVGAGPAGITSVAKLLDQNINPKEILWIDPIFKVGDFGTKWREVSGNTKIKSFINYFKSCQSFQYNDLEKSHELFSLNPEETCKLSLVADVLTNITKSFETLVNISLDYIEHLSFDDNLWHIQTKSNKTIKSDKVVLATGAKPKILNYHIPNIDLDKCFDINLLKEEISNLDTTNNTSKTIAVFGSSHSAILILKNLAELNSTGSTNNIRIINFYKAPLKYALELDDCILYDNTGLKGVAAKWAKDNLSSPTNLKNIFIERYLATESNIEKYLNLCNKVIYAIGFERLNNITISGLGSQYNYDHHTGIIAPGLFGVGIGYPEYITNRFGISEYNVGLLKFANYLNKIMPIWINY